MRKVEILSICTAKYVIILRSFQLLVMGKKIIYNSIFIKQNAFYFQQKQEK